MRQSAKCLNLLLNIKEVKADSSLAPDVRASKSAEASVAFYSLQSALTWDYVVFCDSPSLFKISMASYEACISSVALLVELLNKSLNIQSKLHEEQVVEIAITIIEDKDYRSLKLEELVYIFKQGKMGKYGSNYAKIDITTICEWIDAYLYDQRRFDALEQHFTRAHVKPVGEEGVDGVEFTGPPEWFIEKIKAVKKKHTDNKLALSASVRRTEEEQERIYKQNIELLQSTMGIMPRIISNENKVKINALALRIAAGERNYSVSDMALQNEFPTELEQALKAIKARNEKEGNK